MARTYAGVMGFLAVVTTLLRGVLSGSGLEGTMAQAGLAMIAMAVVGAFVGAIAEATVDESVRVRLEKQLAEADLLAPAEEGTNA